MIIETFANVPSPLTLAMATSPDVLSELTRDNKPKTFVEQTKFQHVVKDIG